MFEIHILLSILLFILLSFFDFIIFNEEILLALCFLSFLFYCFNTLSESIFSNFESRAAKFEQDLLFSFNATKSLVFTDFNSHLRLRFFINQFTILMCSLLWFLSTCLTFLRYKATWIYFQACLSKLNELLLINKNFVDIFQKTCIVQLLYSLILKKSSNDLAFLLSNEKKTKKLIVLKNLSII